jgi:hypothetical protein
MKFDKEGDLAMKHGVSASEVVGTSSAALPVTACNTLKFFHECFDII